MTPLEWFQHLYTNGSSQGWLTLSYKRDAAARFTPDDPFATEWFHVANLELAAQRAEALATDHNVYFGLALRRERLTGNQRGSWRDAVAIPGLWVELDAGPHESGKRYFATKDDALEFLGSLPHQPTVVIDSGGGLHAYWLFRELWEFEDDELEYGAALVRGWQGFIRDRARAAGADVDSTYDLARVLRVPGTRNLKGEVAREVKLVRNSGPEYNPGDFDQWRDFTGTMAEGTAASVTVKAGVSPPLSKFSALYANDSQFKQTWDGKRRDFKDQSPSAYCMSLASLAAAAGWSDQEIADLLVHYRETQGAKPKTPGWYALTIGKARRGSEQHADEARTLERVTETPEPDEKMAGLSQVLGFKLLRIVKMETHDPSEMLTDPWYIIETDRGKVRVPDPKTLGSYAAMRPIILGALDLLLKVKAKEWPRIVDAMMACLVTEEAPIESSPYEEVRAALGEYIAGKSAVEDPVKAADQGMLFKHEGRLWFSLSRFADWCHIRKHMRVGPRNLPGMLQSVGCKKTTLHNVRRGSQRTSLNWWSVPEGV